MTARLILMALVFAALAGCSEVEPRSGTRVTLRVLEDDAGREEIADVSRYLIRRSADVLDADRARVESVKDGRIVLLLPGVRVTRKEAARLLDTASIEFYHLKNVASEGAPDRPWRIRVPETGRASYLFAGPDAQLIDSRREPEEVLKRVVGAPAEKPILTGDHTLPTATYQTLEGGIVVYVEFDARGAKIFHEFTRDHKGELLAVFYNGVLISAPVITEPISGGRASVTGFRTLAEARSAVAKLNAGRLPLKVRIESVEPY